MFASFRYLRVKGLDFFRACSNLIIKAFPFRVYYSNKCHIVMQCLFKGGIINIGALKCGIYWKAALIQGQRLWLGVNTVQHIHVK